MIKIKDFLLFSIIIVLSFSQYNQDLGKKLCRLTVASYCNIKKVQNWTCGPCQQSPLKLANVKVFLNSTGDSVGYIATSAQLRAILLIFRGTLPWDLKNWISDINFIPTSYPLCDNGCQVHRGFYDAYKQINPQVMTSVNKYISLYGLDSIVIGGHSLGGALSYHAAGHLLAAGKKILHLYTYGAPRVGNQKYVDWFQKVYGSTKFKARVTHSHDPVPHLPLKDWKFFHLTTEIYYDSTVAKGYVVCSSTTGEDPKCADKNNVDTNVVDHLTYYDIDFAGIIVACQA